MARSLKYQLPVMVLSQRLLHISVLMGALWLCLAAAHDILEVDADATMTATVEVPTAKEVEELGWKIEAQLALMNEAHEHLIRIETLTRCPAEDIRDTPGRAWPRGPQEDKEKREQQRWRWCKSVPELVFPSGQVPDWDFEALYTMNWTNVDDAYAQRFQWRTRHCGKLNKSEIFSLQRHLLMMLWSFNSFADQPIPCVALEQGQRSMQFIFKEMAAEFPKKQCDYSIDDFFKLANSSMHGLRVEQPLNPQTPPWYGSGIVLRPNDELETIRYMP